MNATWSTGCFICGGTGLRVVHRQGDPVPGYPYNQYTRTFWGSTLYETCECRIIRSVLVAGTPPLEEEEVVDG